MIKMETMAKSCLFLLMITIASFAGCIQETVEVDFSYAPFNPSTGDTINFVGTFPDANKSVDTWLWDFDDGNSSSERQPTYQFTKNGTYEVKLIVVTNDDKSYSVTKNITVVARANNPPSTPEITPSSNQQKIPWKYYLYSASTTDPENDTISYKFDWGDNTTSGWKTDEGRYGKWLENHAWNTTGNYKVRVKAKDEHGAESSWSTPVNVTIDAPTAPVDFSIPTLENNTFSLAEKHGTIVIIVFSETICSWCDSQIDILQNVLQEEPSIEILSIYIQQYPNDEDTIENVTTTKEESGSTWVFAVDTTQTNITGGFIEDYREHLSIPTLFIIDKQGYISFSKDKIVEEEKILEEIQKIN